MADPTSDADVLDQVQEGMPFTIDVLLLATFHVAPGANLTDAVNVIRELAGRAVDVDLGDGVTLHQVSVRGQRRLGMVLVSGPCTDVLLRLDGLQEPAVCRTCRAIHDETKGDGKDGQCAACVDTRPVEVDGHSDGDGCGIYDTGYRVTSDGSSIAVEDLEVGDVYEDPAYPGDWHQVNEVVVVDDDVHVASEPVE